jgi:hypothetical protein
MSDKPTKRQLSELKRLCREARVPDKSEIITTREEAEVRIRDVRDTARTE